jgi:hypothetical protein
VSPSGWKYRSRTGTGIASASLKVSHSVAGLIKFNVKGRNGTWSVDPTHLPIGGMLILDPPNATKGECGNAAYPGAPSCVLSPSSLKCH